MPRDDILRAAEAWAEHDPDPVTQRELRALIAERPDELAERFHGPLEFGTAGLRGILGAGESRMNRAVVRLTSAGLARYLHAHVPRASERGVVVGYDGRRSSDVFAEDTTGVLCAAGIPVHLSESRCPTPIVAYGVLDRKAAAGVMVTASHNPPEYNGYKVYADNGAQIIPPADSEIAAAIASVGPADEVPMLSLSTARDRGLVHDFGDALDRRYLDAIEALCPVRGRGRDLAVVYTPLHGVGNRLFRRAMADVGFDHVHSVAQQAEPDGEFPTVAFPNPEEPGALDLALALAREKNAAIIIANDPDADRLAVAVRDDTGAYTQLTGNELGVLLGHELMKGDGDDRLVIASLVSSPLLGVIARDRGIAYAETLTGFKWIANKAIDLERQGKRFVFGYEEALGYTVGTVVRDKDGIGAAVVLANLAAELYANGETLLDELERIAQRYGLFASGQRTLSFPGATGPSKMAALMDALRSDPPRTIADQRVLAITDFEHSTRTTADEVTPIDFPKSDVLVFDLEGGHRIIARPSGTEPKMKLYFDVREPMSQTSLTATKSRASHHITTLADALLSRLPLQG